MALRDTVRLMILEGLVKLSDTAKKAISVQVQVDEEDTADDVPLYQPQGFRVRPPRDAEAILLAIEGEGMNTVAVAAMDRDSCPTDDIEQGEGGLYYAGTWKVFMDKDGNVHLGDKVGADFVALAQKVLDELNAVKSAFDGHTHTVPITGPAGNTASTPPVAPMPSPSSVAATKVKAT